MIWYGLEIHSLGVTLSQFQHSMQKLDNKISTSSTNLQNTSVVWKSPLWSSKYSLYVEVLASNLDALLEGRQCWCHWQCTPCTSLKDNISGRQCWSLYNEALKSHSPSQGWHSKIKRCIVLISSSSCASSSLFVAMFYSLYLNRVKPFRSLTAR